MFWYVPVLGSEIVELRPYLRILSLNGFTRPLAEMVVSAEVSGRCLSVSVDVGDAIPASGVVARLDNTFVQLDLEKNIIAQKQARRQLELEKKTLGRYTALINSQSTPQATYEDAALKADIHALTLDGLMSDEKRLREFEKRHVLYGPPGWLVTERFIEPGEYAQPGGAVVRAGDFRQLLVPLLLTHEELVLLRQQQTISLFFPETGLTVKGSLYRVAPDIDEKSRKIPVDILVESALAEQRPFLRGGMRVTLELAGKPQDGLFEVPRSALLSRYDSHWLVAPDGKRTQVIYIQKSDDGMSAVVSGEGLGPGERFLNHPAEVVDTLAHPVGR